MREFNGKLCNALSLEDAAWIGAFFDAEGSARLADQYDPSGFYVSRVAHVKICQNEREVLDWIKEMTGIGNVYPEKTTTFRWQTQGRPAISFLEAIEGWIRTKNHKERVEEVLAHYEMRNS
jgi:hypothetical protein